MKYWIYLLIAIMVFPIVSATLTISGNCNTFCSVNSSYYKLNLTEGIISHWRYTAVATTNWASLVNANDGLGEIYSGAWIFSKTQTLTNCSNKTNNYSININCYNSTAFINWTFYETYIQQNVYVASSYRIYDFFTNVGNASSYNETKNIVLTNTYTVQNTTSKVGAWGIGNTAVFIRSVNSTRTFDVVNDSGGAWGAMAWGRNLEIPAGSLTVSYITVMTVSASNKLAKIKEFSTFPELREPFCIYNGTNHFIVNTRICNITNSYNVESGKDFNITNSTVYLRSNSYVKGYKYWHILKSWVHQLRN